MTTKDLIGIEQQEIVKVQRRFWEALKSKDQSALEEIIAEDFVSRTPDEPDQVREEFIATLAEFPGRVVSIGSDNLEVGLFGNTGVVSGVQVARVQFDNGGAADDRIAITNVYRRDPSGWRMVFTHAVELPIQG